MFKTKLVGVLVLLFTLGVVFSAHAEQMKITDGMKQGDFAMALINNLGAQGQLPTAATVQDAFKFLEKLGVVPANGWDEEGIVDSKVLMQLLGLEASGLSFEELLQKLMDKLANILWSMGIRTVTPQTISP